MVDPLTLSIAIALNIAVGARPLTQLLENAWCVVFGTDARFRKQASGPLNTALAAANIHGASRPIYLLWRFAEMS